MTRAVRWYIGAVTVAGVAGLAYSSVRIAQSPVEFTTALLFVRYALVVALAVASGLLPIRIPGLDYNVYLSETFFFALALLFGGERAAVWMAVSGLVIALRRQWEQPLRVLFNFAEPVVSMLTAAAVFYTLYGAPPLAVAPAPEIGVLLLPAAAMATVYVLMNTGLTAAAMWAAGEQSLFAVWRKNLTWFSLSYFGGASVAVLLAFVWQTVSMSALVLTLPLGLIFLLIFRNVKERANEAKRHLDEQRELARKHLDEQRELYMSIVEALAMAIEAKDEGTSGHVKRVRRNVLRLARSLGVAGEKDLLAIENAALLHDIGKLHVPDYILRKPGRLTKLEFEEIKKHAPVGANILKRVPFPFPVEPIVRHHHENWDGTGYPDGLRGEAIPIGARIIAVMDCYEALREDRPYRPALSDQAAMAIIEARRGSMYDPSVIDAFLGIHPEIAAEIDAEAGLAAARPEASSEAAPPPPEAPGGSSPELTAALLALSDLASELAGLTPVEDLAAALGSRLRQTVPSDLVVFYVRDGLNGDLVAVHAAGDGGEALKGMRLQPGEGLSGWVAINRATIVNSSGTLDLADRRHLLPATFESTLATPLCAHDDVVGVLALYAGAREAFTGIHKQIVEFAARQIGPALAEALGCERDRMASLFDAETGLPNQAYLDRVLTSANYCCQSNGTRPGVLLFSSGGRANGPAAVGPTDACERLGRLATTCRVVVRVTDLVFRTGEDEVAVFIADATPDSMATVARRVAEALSAGEDGRGGTAVESSFALYPDHAEALTDLPRAARARGGRPAPRTLLPETRTA